jgi:hypothetical protein
MSSALTSALLMRRSNPESLFSDPKPKTSIRSWDDFCLENGIDPFIQSWEGPFPILQVFGQRYRDGQIAPRKNAVRAPTVEDSLRAVSQAFARVGSPDVRKNIDSNIDFQIQLQIRAYKREDSPPPS